MSLVQRLDAIHLRLADVRHEYLGLTNGRRKEMEAEIEALYAEKRAILATPLLFESQQALKRDRALFTEADPDESPILTKDTTKLGIRAPKRTYKLTRKKGAL